MTNKKFCDILFADGRERWIEVIQRPKYKFKKELKMEFIRGYRFDYLANKIGISYSYLLQILRGSFNIDPYLVEKIMTGIGYDNEEINKLSNYYFEKVQ